MIIRKTKKLLPAAAAISLLALLMLYSSAARTGAYVGLELCAQSIIPSLLPFMTASALLNKLGFPAFLSSFAGGIMQRLFGVSGDGAAAFVIGLTGGYPLGAASVAELYRSGSVSKDEAERLLAFCNNSGPAFILGAAGAGVFGSAAVGLYLYSAHILAAALTGIIMRSGPTRTPIRQQKASLSSPERFPAAFAQSVSSSAASTISICGFVVFFSALINVLTCAGVFSSAAGRISSLTGLGLTQVGALLRGILELGTGISVLSGLEPGSANLALCAFILGWGGLSVHCQTLSVLSGTGLSAKKHFAGRILCAVIAAAIMYVLGFII